MAHQLRGGVQIPIGRVGIDVPEVGGEQRHGPLDINAGLMPAQQGLDGERVPEVMRATVRVLGAWLRCDLAD